MNTSQKSIDMVNGPLLKNIFLFAVPIMFTSLLQMLFNAADTVIVGKFSGENALAAVGATSSIIFFLTSLFNGLSVGANVVIAQLFGEQNEKKISEAVHTAMLIAITGGILLTVIAILIARRILELMSTPSEIIDLSHLYLIIYFGGVISLIVYNFGAAILRSKGDTKRPLYYLFASGILNVILNLIFVIVFKWSVAGVALATIISEGMSALLVINTLIHENDATKLNIRKLKLNVSIALDIMRVGIPAGIQTIVFSLSNIVVQSSLNSFDSAIIVAGNSAALNIENFVYIGMSAFTQATITFTSQNIGAKNYQAIKKILWTTFVLTFISGFSVSLVIWVFGRFFLSLYTNDIAVIDAGMVRLTYVTLLLVINGLLDVFVCSMRGMGNSLVPTIVMIIGICVIRMCWLWFVFPHYSTLECIYICFPISWIVTTIVQYFLWLKTYHQFMSL